MKNIYLLGAAILFVGIIFSLVFAQETLTISTYYPSPYGSYGELRSQKVAIGDNYTDGAQYCWTGTCTNTIDTNADLVVEGSVGIGTVTPQRQLTVANVVPEIGLKNTGDNLGWSTIAFPTTVPMAGNFSIFEYTNAAWSAAQPRLTVQRGGNVGIGTQTPAAKLEVNGTVQIDTGGATNKLVCWKADGKTLGNCSVTAGTLTNITCTTCN